MQPAGEGDNNDNDNDDDGDGDDDVPFYFHSENIPCTNLQAMIGNNT